MTARLRTLDEYTRHRSDNARIYEKIGRLEETLARNNKREFTVKGFSYPAQKTVDFKVDYQYSDNMHINWRERVICPITGLNNRIRAAIHFIDFEIDLDSNSNIYIAEQVTPLYQYLKKKYSHLTGSEYLGPDARPGSVNEKGLRHENATGLSFADDSLDAYLTFDCLEHVPDYMAAFRDAYRVLKPGGVFCWSVPFANGDQENIIRAIVNADGSINHILPPEYHGDPVNADGGILCYQVFGWQMFDQLRSIGFKDAYAITYWSDTLGYYNRDQFLFFAVK